MSAAFPETAGFLAAMDQLEIRFVPLHGDAAVPIRCRVAAVPRAGRQP
ncbi:MAG TPA: hypothetical protein VE709_15550 [Pseudonocardiaceae bacterium]|nr:hypothetical protein [Pseudonocardiaceae bacterium]